MANQQAQLHSIPLATANLNTTKYKVDVSPYEGFLKQNSPFYGNILSTFYTKQTEAPATSIFVSSDGSIYYINESDGCLYKQDEDGDKKLLHSNHFITKVDNDADIPIDTSPAFDYTVTYATGAVNAAMSRTMDVWTSEDDGITYEQKTIQNRAVNNVVTANYSPRIAIEGKTYAGIPLNTDGKYQGGIAKTIVSSTPGNIYIRALYNNMSLQGYSVALDDNSIGTLLCGLGTIDVDKPCEYDAEHIKFFLSDGTFCSIKFTDDPNDVRMNIANNRYIILNYAEYYNCWDTLLDKPFHFASDYNNRAISYASGGAGATQTTLAAYVAAAVANVSATGVYSNFAIANVPFSSTQFAIALEYYVGTFTMTSYIQKGYSPDNQWIEVFRGKLRDSTYPLYVCSYNNENSQIIDTSLVETRYTNSFYGIPSIFADFTKSYLNKSIILDWDYSYLQTYVNGTKYIFAYSAEDELEHVQAAFVIQGQDFVVINSIIYRYYAESGQLQACVNIDEMRFVGNTPYNAIFWSDTNKTFYTFTGDNLLNVLLQANEVNVFYDSGYNPNTMSVYAVLDTGTYIFTQEQLIKIEGTYKNIYALASGAALFDGHNIVYYAYNALPGYAKTPIELQTQFYGQGNNIVSVNDCVYLRLYDDGSNSEGVVELNCVTLNQFAKQSETKTFNITADMWDEDSHTLFLRYQPKYQEATGFSVYIKSDFAIAELKISEIPVAVQNSKYNI